ncbi:MAG: replication-associated recombination protein A [Candidatus Hydrogenedentota bacterium]|nr:MAG: replication-associated recombination protein A [Candidatus Hydrogenedentota bacterium]
MQPLAERMRPRKLADIVGQTHLLGEGKPLNQMVKAGSLRSMLFCGPPGCGKTTLAQALAREVGYPFVKMSAVDIGVKQIRDLTEKKAGLFASGENPKPLVLFLDEIHRFNKAQQDSLLGPIENGTLILIGATTENPAFAIQSALLSRVSVFYLKPLSNDDLLQLFDKAIQKDPIFQNKEVVLENADPLLRYAAGDARAFFNLLEILATNQRRIIINEDTISKVQPEKLLHYDKAGDMHYHLISAFIKSLRGSDPDAALYYLARMLVGGEDPVFIARRMVIFAAEDIGNANPMAVVFANSIFEAVRNIGMPEARILLSQCVTYLALAEKSNASYIAINRAIDYVKQHKEYPVPLHLRNASTDFLKSQGYGQGYKYPHDYHGFVNQNYFPDGMNPTSFYQPKNIGQESKFLAKLKSLWPNRLRIKK